MRRTVLFAIAALLLMALPVGAVPDECSGVSVTDDRPTDQYDALTGTSNRDVASLGAGPDMYASLGGNDLLCGDNGGDDLILGNGDDEAYGLADNDGLRGGGGDDLLYGGTGMDAVWGETDGYDSYGDDVLYGGGGEDELVGGNGDDVLRDAGSPGDGDNFFDGGGHDVIVGDASDFLYPCKDTVSDDLSQFEGTVKTAKAEWCLPIIIVVGG
jgi:Ca2+-binding RTX toxin-like protein